MKVTLRKKPISGGRQTLYLDFYPPIPNPKNGKTTRREFLKLYVFKKPKIELHKKHNKETLALAESIRAQRQLWIQSENYGFLSDEKQNADFVQYFEKLAKKRSGSNSDNWHSALNYLRDFSHGPIFFKDVNESFCNNFKDYLLNVPTKKSSKAILSQNSALSYFNKFKATLKQAYRENYLEIDLDKWIIPIKQVETERQFLTLEELQKLADTEFSIPILKKAALFSALTGLRFSDIKKLIWGELQHSSYSGHYIRFKQKKTKGYETLPISQQAFSLLGERRESDQIVFENLKYSAWQNIKLQEWVKNAGIHKSITFHCFRHTYATLQITLGTDLFTVSKMLGHREIKTTQVYAKIIDEQKQIAANKIKLIQITKP